MWFDLLAKLILLLTIAVVYGKTSSDDCLIPIGSKQDYLSRWPLVFKPNGELFGTFEDDETGERKIIVKAGEEVVLSCGPNYLKQYGRKESLDAQCNGETGKFVVNDSEKRANELTCDLRVIEEVLDNVYGCVDTKWTSARYGYLDPIEKKTFLLGEVCYDVTEGTTRFVHTKLGNKASEILDKLPSNYLTSRRHPDGRYKIELFRGLQFDQIYERLRGSLRIRHTPQLKMAHFIDEPLLGNEQFQAIKKLGWNYYVGFDENEILETLKSDIRHLSENLGPLDLYLGSHGVKKFYGPDRANMELYLHEAPQNRFPMPDLLWFVVKQGNKATAFGVWNEADNVNRIEGENLETNDITNNLCKNSQCDQITWLSESLKNGDKLICCNVEDFRKNILEVPALGDVKELLK